MADKNTAVVMKKSATIRQKKKDTIPAVKEVDAVVDETAKVVVEEKTNVPDIAAKTPREQVSSVRPKTAADNTKRSETVRAENKKHSDRDLSDLYKLYLHNVTKVSADEELELEIKFGTMNSSPPITRINYDNVLKKLLSSGFYIDENVYLLRINNEYMDPRTGAPRLSNIRTEITGIQNIRLYCQTNRLDGIENGIAYIEKARFKTERPTSVDVRDYNFRVSLSNEVKLDKNTPMVRTTLEKWNDRKKTFRYLNRFKLRHPSLPVVVDMSIVKDSKRQDRHYIPEYNIHDSGVFTAFAKYEIEIECLNSLVGIGTAFQTADLLNAQVFKPVIKYILSGIQETNYPIGYPEQDDIFRSYGKLIWGKDYSEDSKDKKTIDFIGPSSFTLELHNIMPINPAVSAPNIRENYTVTDKADGDRKLLFIAPNGKIYLITTNMEIQFTGNVSKNKDLWNTLIDGEHVLYDKKKKFINMYAAFDIYYVGGEDIRSKAFMPIGENEMRTNFRLLILNDVVDKIYAVSIVNEAAPVPLKITKKRFYLGTDSQSIFQGCSYILKKEQDGLFEYETDGLIFTPANMGVGAKVGQQLKPLKISWEYSFKWKPVEFNTIDFLVSIKKNEAGTDVIGSTFNNGLDLSSSSQITDYKTVILRVGFDEKQHGFVNPRQDAINDLLPTFQTYDERKENTYLPLQFYPTDPSDYNAGICHIPLTGIDKKMFSENDEIIEDNMIVEFRYDPSREEEWRWIPLRVRYDKTAKRQAGKKMFGNDFKTANNVWHTIHHPITQAMIQTGENIPEELGDDDVYYNKVSSTTNTAALRDFHNLYVKSLLIKSVAKPGGTLIDLAVGKGGDWPKWIKAKLKFVFGIDISRDNIQNRLNGAYARYLDNKKTTKIMPAALFVNGDSRLNIKKTTGIVGDKDVQITKAVFGQGPKDAAALGQGVYKQYGVATEGFDVCSIQFAIHYMFETQETLQNFLRNVSEVTKEGGYFIGTSYDGEKLFKMLKNLPENDSKVISATDEKTGHIKKIWELTKRYDHTEYNADESCVGYAVDVFQESINKTFREYLVNYTYLTRVLENYGFVLASSEDLRNLQADITKPTGFFNELFQQMNNDIKDNPRDRASYKKAPDMTDGERTISFLNRYFIYKKVRKVSDTEKVSQNLQQQPVDEIRDEVYYESSLEPTQATDKTADKTKTAAANTKERPKVKINRTAKPKLNLSIIPEQVEQQLPSDVYARSATAPALEPATEPAPAPVVKKLKLSINKLKGSKTKNTSKDDN
jgi:SAM-dependent methyltransferase